MWPWTIFTLKFWLQPAVLFDGEDNLETLLTQAGEEEKKDEDESVTKKDEDAGKDDRSADPDVEMEFTKEDGSKESKKVKLSELKKGYMLNDDYTRKTQALAEEKEKYKPIIDFADSIKGKDKMIKAIQHIYEKGFADEKYLDTILGQVADKKEDVEDKKDEIEEALASLDKDDPMYGVLSKTLKSLKLVASKLDTFETQLKSRQEQDERSAFEKQVASAQQVLNDEIETASKGLEFDSDKEKAFWRKLVIADLKDNPKNYSSVDAFKSTIKDLCSKYHAQIKEVGEGKIAEYLKKKKTPIPAGGGAGKKEKEEVSPEVNLQTITEDIAKALEEEAAKNT